MSLRARLIAGLLALAAVGLGALGAITYAEQRSFLFDRVDQQTRSAPLAMGHALDEAGGTIPGVPEHHRPDEPGETGPAGANLPPGTYGERRNAAGKAVGHVRLSYGEKALAAPAIP